jgi:excisionase family DNA binding protein
MELDKPFYSPHEVAEMAGLHPSTILNYIGSGRLYAVKLSERTYRIPARSVLHLLAPEQLDPPVRVLESDEDTNRAVDDEIGTASFVSA